METFDDLVAYLEKQPDLPDSPIMLRYEHVIYIPASLFIDSCKRRHEKGDTRGLAMLRRYKNYVETGPSRGLS